MLKNRFFWIAAVIGLVLDRTTKLWVVKTMAEQQSIPLWAGVFHFTYVLNPGAAFSLFPNSVWLPWLSLIVSVGLMGLAWFGARLPRWEQWGYGFVLSGALGNGIDRFVQGKVIDFLDFRLINFPIFNLADVFINVGIVCLLIATFRKPLN
jgi:signal peptidase II